MQRRRFWQRVATVVWGAAAGSVVFGAGAPDRADRTTASAIAIAIPAGAEPMKIDGAATEEIWTKAQPITEFLQRDPNEGQKPTHPTEARVAYDNA